MLDDYDSVPYTDEKDILTFMNTFIVKMKFFKNKAGQEIGFKLELLNQGFTYLDGGVGGTKKEIQVEDADGEMQPVATPQLLSPTGELTTEASYTERTAHDLIGFAQFGLPNEFPVY